MVRFIGGGYSNSSRLMALDLMSPLGEVMACLVRVPTDNVKQNLQAGRYTTTTQALRCFSGLPLFMVNSIAIRCLLGGVSLP